MPSSRTSTLPITILVNRQFGYADRRVSTGSDAFSRLTIPLARKSGVQPVPFVVYSLACTDALPVSIGDNMWGSAPCSLHYPANRGGYTVVEDGFSGATQLKPVTRNHDIFGDVGGTRLNNLLHSTSRPSEVHTLVMVGGHAMLRIAGGTKTFHDGRLHRVRSRAVRR